jgi:hypothetical protein
MLHATAALVELGVRQDFFAEGSAICRITID